MKKLLVMSNDDALLATLWRYLEPELQSLIVTGSGWVGLELARLEYPDAILCTTSLFGLDGYEVLQAVRADASTTHTPFILVSDRLDLESRCMAIALGADDYLTQPIPLNQLLLAIQIQLSSNNSALSNKVKKL